MLQERERGKKTESADANGATKKSGKSNLPCSIKQHCKPKWLQCGGPQPTIHVKKREEVTMHRDSAQDSIILGTAQIKIKGTGNRELSTRALCDNGSQVNLVTTSIIQQLGEKPRVNQTSFIGVGGSQLGSAMGETTLKIQLKNGRCMVSNFYVVKKITNYSPMSNYKTWEKLKGNLSRV